MRLFITLLLCSFLAGCTGMQSWQHLPASQQEETSVHVVSHDWHTGLVIRAENLGELSFLNAFFGDNPYYEIGWGDREFYQAAGRKTGLALRALFLPTDSVLHVVALSQVPAVSFPQSRTIEIKISKKGHGLLNRAIARSFERDAGGAVMQLQAGLYGRSFFFAGSDTFFMTRTCNSWTAGMLREAGVPISTMTISADSVMSQAERAVAAYTCCPGNR